MEDNSVLNEESVNEETGGSAAPRKSLSQPSLAVEDPAPAIPKRTLSGAHSSSNVRSIPIIETWHQNEELKGQIWTLKSDLQMQERRYLEAKEACHAKVQDVLDEYVELKINKEEVDLKFEKFHEMEAELRDLHEKLDHSELTIARQQEEFQRQKEQMEQRIRELEAITDGNNTTCGSLRGTLDDILKKNDPDFTLSNGYEERKIQELEEKLKNEMDKVAELQDHIQELRREIDDQSARLADAENARIQLEAAGGQGLFGAIGAAGASQTFAIGTARESQAREQCQYIDELETNLKKATQEVEAARMALVEYMNRCSKLENELHRKNSTMDQSSLLFNGRTAEELKEQVDKVNRELNQMRAENRQLRIRCDQLTGGDGNVSVSFGESRLMAAGVDETGGTSMRILPRESALQELDEVESKLPLMDTSAAARNKADFDAAWAQFKCDAANNLHDTLESSFNSSMPPPGRDATQSFLSQKGFRNSPLKLKENATTAEKIQNASFSTKTASPMRQQSLAPILGDVQQILDSSALLLDKQHDAQADVEKMQAKMTQIREALNRLFERLKSSAALFEEILEKMGSSSPLADRIKEMQLAFETSMCDNADLTGFLEAAEKDLTNMSLNFSILEKSIVSQSFVADVSRRFGIAPDAEDIASSSLLNASYSPIFKFSNDQSETIEKLKKEIFDLRQELEKSRLLEIKSPIQNSPSRLSDVQIKAAQNFEELEVCQATLKKVESEKAAMAKDLAELDNLQHTLTSQLSEVRAELEHALERVAREEAERRKVEEHLEQTNQLLMKHREEIVDVEESNRLFTDNLKEELQKALKEENNLRDYLEEMREEMDKMKWIVNDAEERAQKVGVESQERLGLIVDLETRLEKMNVVEESIGERMATRRAEKETIKGMEEFEKNAVDGLEHIQKEMVELTKKTLKARIIKGNSSSIRLVCEEICRRITRERERQHEDAQTLSEVYEKFAHLEKEQSEQQKENQAPVKMGSLKEPTSSTTSTATKFVSPTRQLLHESTMAVDGIVQRLKKTNGMAGMGAELREVIAKVITDSRALRDFLHQKLVLFKGIDLNNCKNESVEKLIARIEQYHQDNLMLEEQIGKYKRELKQTRAVIPSLGADVQERIKREIGGIAKDMGAVKGMRKK